MNPFSLSQQQISTAANMYGTPLYLYDLDKIDVQYIELVRHLPDNFTVHYAMKANSNLAICSRLAQLGASADVSSSGELYVAQQAGFLPEQTVVTGPGKTDRELSLALEAGCKLIVLESINEAHRLNQLARERGKIQDVLLRINPMHRTGQSCEISQGAGHLEDKQTGNIRSQIQLICQQTSKFGVDQEVATPVIAEICQLSNLNLKGIHIFTESNVLDYKDLLASWENTIAIANELRTAGYPIEIIDFGGGIGIPYNATDRVFDVEQFGTELQELFDRNPFQYQCLIEIGRYIVGDAGCYITEVVDIKTSRGEEFVILNGGIHQLFRISPYMIEASKYMDVLDKTHENTKKVTLAGKLPTAMDVLVKGLDVPENIAIGDKIVIYNCGSYGFNHGMSNFILNPNPAEATYKDGTLSLIRSRGNEENFLIGQDTGISKYFSSVAKDFAYF